MSKQWQLLPIGEPVEMALESEKEHYIKENHDSVVAIAASTGIAPILNVRPTEFHLLTSRRSSQVLLVIPLTKITSLFCSQTRPMKTSC